MTKKLIHLFAILFGFLQANGQEIRVLDKDSKLPIAGVEISVSNSGLILDTDRDGMAELDLFSTYKPLKFSHPDYLVYEFSLRKIKKMKYEVFLTKRSEYLNEIVLSASRKRENRNQVAEQINIITSSEIKKMAPQTSADLLSNTAGVRVQKSQFGGGSPVLRGMEANRVLLVIDGVRMNNAIYRKGHLQSAITVSPLSLERTEVVFGPSSLMYGSDALGGVIHFYTQKPKPSEENAFNLSTYSRFSSANQEITNQLSFEIIEDKWSTYTSVSYSDFDDLKMGSNRVHGFEDWGLVPFYSENTRNVFSEFPTANGDEELQKNTGYNQLDILQKFIFALEENRELTFNFQYSKSSDIPRFDKLTESSGRDLKFAEWSYGPQKRFLASAQLTTEVEKKWMNSANFILAYQHLEEERLQRKFGSLDRSYRNEFVDVFSLNADFTANLKGSSFFQYGLEVIANGVASRSSGNILEVSGNEVIGISGYFDVQSRYPDGGSTYNNQAVYLDFKTSINPKGALSAGVRYTATQLRAKWQDESFITLPSEDIKLSNGALTAQLSYVYSPNNNWQLSTLVSSGFRSPNIDDVGKIREKSGFVSVPNVNLKPEYAYNGEIGLTRYFNKQKFRVGINAYYTLLDKYIMREIFDITGAEVNLSSPPTINYDGEEVISYANVNKGLAYVYGFTFDARGEINRFLSANSSFTYTKGRSYDEGIPLSSIPPYFGSIGVDFTQNKIGLGLNFDFNGAKNPEDYNLIEGIDNFEQTPFTVDSESGEFTYYGTPAWSVLNFNSSYAINQYVEFQFMVQNILDVHYKEFASAISAPGRNYIGTVVLNF
jgi:hemoglobin/transferrin/lactoferrin receptor protein